MKTLHQAIQLRGMVVIVSTVATALFSMPAAAQHLTVRWTTDPVVAQQEPTDDPADQWGHTGPGGTVDIQLQLGQKLYFAMRNRLQEDKTKWWAFEIKTDADGGLFPPLGSTPTVDGFEDTNDEDPVEKELIKEETDIGTQAHRVWYKLGPPQPKWERITFDVVQGMPQPITISVAAWSYCGRREPVLPSKLVMSGMFGALGAMVDEEVRIREVWVFPCCTPVSEDEAFEFNAPPDTGPWEATLIDHDPEGNVRPTGGVLYSSSGAGLAADELFSFGFGMQGTADLRYTIYSVPDQGGLGRYELRFAPDAPPCPADLNGSGAVDVQDLLILLGAWGPCPKGCAADLNGSDTVDVQDLLILLGAWGPCPVNACDFTDIRVGIDGAWDDAEEIQRNYDAINRTAWLFRDVPFSMFFDAPFAAMLPPILDRLHRMEQCTGLPTDVSAIEAALFNVAAVVDAPLRSVFSTPAADMPEAHQALDQLRLLDIGLPPAAHTADEAALHAWGINQLVKHAGDLTYHDFMDGDEDAMTPEQLAALQDGLIAGPLEFSIWEDIIGNNHRCCCTAINNQGVPWGHECCRKTADKKWCKKRIDGNLCRVSADTCVPVKCVTNSDSHCPP